MENLGSLAILMAFCVALYATLASAVGRVRRKPFLIVSGQRAVYCIWALITLAAGILIHALMSGDFRFAYVAEHSNHALPTIYKFTALWSGQEGSLLFWTWLLTTYTAVVAFTNRRRHRDMMPWVLATLTTVETFFLVLNNFVANPFKMLATDGLIVKVPDGNGLSPVLQYPAMAIHPPMLYLGYVGFAVPFAFAMGSLITRQSGDAWIHTTRRWTLVTWLFQSCGVMLGAAWAYHVLGWGGYWAWDPVENASLLPWLSGTAFLHSVMMQEKKGMMKVWNMVLVSATFFLCIFGTSMTRGGLVQSVHAFARSEIGKYFVSFLAVGIAATTYLIIDRLDYLKSEAQLESVVSRESSFLFNNLILLASCFAVLWGTLFPKISEWITGNQISLDADWYNRLMVPIGLFLLFLTGVGPLFAWRRTSVDSLRRNFQWPGVAALVLVGGLAIAGVHKPYPLISFGFCLFVALTVMVEFYRGAASIAAKNSMNLLRATVELTHRNTRRYGGYLVHMGIVLMFIGFTGHAFNQSEVKEMSEGDTIRVGHYQLKMASMQAGENDNYQWHRGIFQVYKDGDYLGTLEPEKRLYKASREGTSEVGIRQRLNEDLYVNFGGMSDDNQRAVIQAYVFPLLSWIWIGGLVLIGGTFVCLVPSKIKMQYARTEVVGFAKKHAPVQS
ncbi:MAG TPA: heme lyase CcmF/NrfE family subunit [Bryobacteraceae bacterium]|nr:heme lyase CcmF/NrfE family subunit [Bryobacteraceae bacterium]